MVFAVLSASLVLRAQIPVFVLQTTVPVSGSPSSLVLGDFNGDGVTDIAVANAGSGTVSILLGSGNGFFLPPRNTATGSGAHFIVAADFNNDGRPDLAVANSGAGTVSILLNNGDATFRTMPSLAVAGASALAVADFDSDGQTDIAVTSASSNNVSIFLGTGSGVFRPPMGPYSVASSPVSIVAADLNGDGIRDLAVAGSGTSTITILLGNGNGTFTSFQNATAGGSPVYMALADVDGDGKPDLVTANSGGGISAMIAFGNGVYQPARNSSTEGSPSFLALADFNGDGKIDAAITKSSGSSVSVLLGSGNGTFQNPLNTATGSGPAWIGVNDLNNDGKLDLVVANSGSNNVQVFLQSSSSSQTPTITGNSIGNAASYQSGTVAPGELVTIFGTNLGPAQLVGLQLNSSGMVANTLAGTQVLFDGIPSPLIYVSAGQVGAVVPYHVAGAASTQVQVTSSTGQSNTVTLSVTDTVPGIFTKGSTGSGQGAIINQNGTVNSDANPASPGDIILIYGTGEGQTNPMGIDGSVTGSNPPQPVASVSATIGGETASVKYDGAAPGFVAGVFQINVKIPKDAASGDLPVLVTIGNAASQAGVTVAVR